MMTQALQTSQVNSVHFSELVDKRGIDPLWLDKNYRSVTKAEARDIGFKNAPSDGYLLIGSNGQKQFKPDVPYTSKDGKPVKYITPSSDSYDVMLPYWEDEFGASLWSNKSLLRESLVEIDGKHYALLTEGFHKAIYGCMNGIATVSAIGVEMALTPRKDDAKGIRRLVPSLEKLCSLVDGFIVAYDADAATNGNVRRATLTTAEALQKAGISVLIATGQWSINEGKGMDDFIQNNGIEAFRERLMKSVPLTDWRTENKPTRTSKKEDGASPIELGQMLTPDYREKYAYHNEQATWRHYNGKIWERINEKAFKATVYHELKGRSVPLKYPAQVTGAVETLESELLIPQWEALDRRRYIAFNDVVYDVVNKSTEAYKPGFSFTNKLPYDFADIHLYDSVVDSLKEHCPNIHWLLNHAMDGDSKRIKRLLAILNAVVTWKFFDLQMFVFLTGKSGAGKGTFMRLASKLVGEENHHGTSMANLSKGTTRAKIIDRQLVTCPDERKKVGIDDLLSLTGGDKVEYEEKYCPSASSYFYGTIIVTSNNPLFVGDTTGIDRRQCLVHFDTPIPTEQRNTNAEASYDSEIAKLIMVVLSMSDKEVEDSIKGRGENEIPSAVYYAWENKIKTDSIAAFINDEVVRMPTSTFSTKIGDGRESDSRDDKSHLSTLYGRYRDYCKRTGMESKKLQNFGDDFLGIVNGYLGWTADKKRTNKGIHIIGEILLREQEIHDEVITHSENLHLMMMGTKESLASSLHGSSLSLPDRALGSSPLPSLGLHQAFTPDENDGTPDIAVEPEQKSEDPSEDPGEDLVKTSNPYCVSEVKTSEDLSAKTFLPDKTPQKSEKPVRPRWSYELSIADEVYVTDRDLTHLFDKCYRISSVEDGGVIIQTNKVGSKVYLMWSQFRQKLTTDKSSKK